LLAQRVATGVVAIPILLLLIWLGGWAYAGVAALVLAVAAAEFAHFKSTWMSVSTVVAAAYAALLAISARTVGAESILLLGLALAVVSLPVGVLWLRGSDFAERVGWLVVGVLYTGVLGSSIVLLRELDHGRDWVLLALLSTFAVDTAAYFTGSAIGRHKLAPTISPKKTWEGFFGGYAGGVAAVALLALVLDVDASYASVILIAVTLPIGAAAGDLFESWVKRRAGVKDASELIPGHGGILDRLDSLLITFPLVYAVARWFA
jgi:phosphatidate cytidylyltransferase